MPWFGHIWGVLCEKAIALKIKINALKQVLDVENAIAAALEHLDLIVEAFNKTTGIPMDEEIRDLLEPFFQGFDEIVKAGQITLLDTFDPRTQFSFSSGFGDRKVKNGCQPFTHLMS
jgi:hypothetical protein